MRYILGIGAFFGLLLGGTVWYLHQQRLPSDTETQEQTASPAASPQGNTDQGNTDGIAALIVQLGVDEKRLIWCQEGRCAAQPQPPGTPVDTVFDGQWWYYYTEQKGEQPRKVLMRTTATGSEPKVIIEETPLTTPRDLIISPDGRYIAYWLDNTHDTERDLTELWVYDTESQSNSVVAEKLVRHDIRTTARWNRAASVLWFIADTAAEHEPDRLEAVVVSIHPPRVDARFKSIEWSALEHSASHMVMDIDPQGAALAYVRQASDVQSEIVVSQEGKAPVTTTVRGTVPYVQWLENGTLLYAVQDPAGVTFWKQKDATSHHVGRSSGFLISAHGRPRGDFVAFLEQSALLTRIKLLDVPGGTIADRGAVPVFGERMHIAKVEVQTATQSHISGARSLDDGQLAAFLERNLSDIAGIPAARSLRFITTDEPNTVYVDFQGAAQQPQRILLIVHDAVNPDWTVRARYESEAGAWKQVEGRGIEEPQPLRLYEWEETVGKWILKEDVTQPR